jgi:hypothetical protein
LALLQAPAVALPLWQGREYKRPEANSETHLNFQFLHFLHTSLCGGVTISKSGQVEMQLQRSSASFELWCRGAYAVPKTDFYSPTASPIQRACSAYKPPFKTTNSSDVRLLSFRCFIFDGFAGIPTMYRTKLFTPK